MSKKDYELIAAALREEYELHLGDSSPVAITRRITIVAIAQRIAIALAKDNSAFNSERFLDATGIRG